MAKILNLDSKRWAAKHVHVQVCTDMQAQVPG